MLKRLSDVLRSVFARGANTYNYADLIRTLFGVSSVVGLFALLAGTIARYLSGIPSPYLEVFTVSAAIALLALILRGVRWVSVRLTGNTALDLIYTGTGTCRQPFIEERDKRKFTYMEQYRVGVKNLTDKTIRNVTVSVFDFWPQGADFLPAPLHLMHNQEKDVEDSQHGVDLKPGTAASLYASVVFMRYRPIDSKEICISWGVPLPEPIPETETYVFALVAQGDDVRECRRYFRTWVDGEGQLQFAGPFLSREQATQVAP